jgi:hypothetical protein
MASKSHTEFEYRYIVNGETIWEKIKILRGFLEGRIRAAALEEVGNKKHQAKVAKLEWLKANNGLQHEILELEADIIEMESFSEETKQLFELNLEEIDMLKRLLEEAYTIANPSRIEGYTDEQMFDLNAANEFTVMIAREIQSEIIAHGHPSPAKIRNAMSNPVTWNAILASGLIQQCQPLLIGSNDPLRVELKPDVAKE